MADVSAVSICSNALLLNGDDPIDSFDVDNARTRIVSNIYTSKRDKVLRAHPWNCATKRTILSPDEERPPFDWAYQTQMPPDCLRVIYIGTKDNPDDWEISGRKILTNTNVVRLKYVFRNDVESTWDPMLVEAMTLVMQVALTYPITRSTSKEELENAILRDYLKQVRAVDGQENPPEDFGEFPLLRNRQ